MSGASEIKNRPFVLEEENLLRMSKGKDGRGREEEGEHRAAQRSGERSSARVQEISLLDDGYAETRMIRIILVIILLVARCGIYFRSVMLLLPRHDGDTRSIAVAHRSYVGGGTPRRTKSPRS